MLWSLPDNILRNMKDSLSELSVELIPIHERLVSLRRQLVALAAKERPAKADLKPIQEELREIDSLSASFVSLPHHLRRAALTRMLLYQETRRWKVPRAGWVFRAYVASTLFVSPRGVLRDLAGDPCA